MPKFQAVIFDRDGVLTHFDFKAAMAYLQPLLPISLEVLAKQWWQWADSFPLPTSIEEEQQLFSGFWEKLSDELSLAPDLRARLQQFDYTVVFRAYPDARPALLAVKERGLRVGVLSNFELADIDGSLASAGLADLVDVACIAPVIGAAKPAPEAYLTVTRALQVPPEACLFFDDEEPGVAGAHAVGMTAYLVDRYLTRHILAEGVVCDLSAVARLLA